MNVYLAGPITGLSYGGATDWRKLATEILALHGVNGVSPLRAKKYLEGIDNLTDAYGDEFSTLSWPKGIVTRDRWDATGCDVVLANLLGAETVSIGTVMEIAWANLANVPLVLAIERERENNPHHHAMLLECSGFITHSLDEALEVVIAIKR